MKALFRTGFLVLAVWLGLSGVSFAKQVFLEDGSVLDCESFWRRNGQLVVKVNRDIVLEFAPGEVDLRKTLQQAKRKTPHVKRKSPRAKHPKGASAVGVPASAAQAAAGPDQANPVQPSAPVPAPAAATMAAKAAPAPPTAVPVAAAEPAARPEPEPAASPAPAPVLDKAELERRTKENVEMMAEAIRKNDQELMKKAVEAQKTLVQQQTQAQKKAPDAASGAPKPEPPWFKYFLMLAFSGLLIIIAMWVIFQKAGHSGVKSIIPVYNFYVLMQISGKPGWWCFLLFVPLVGFAIQLLAMLSLAEKFRRSAAFGVGLLLLPVFFFPLLAFGGSKYGGTAEELNFTFSEEPPVR
ncbi:MAG TPA: hypothetical protein DCZ75_03845 [Geobacter sp.]|nr:hypothetical protein [Geobacter sp.]